jgi:hypothetical protein
MCHVHQWLLFKSPPGVFYTYFYMAGLGTDDQKSAPALAWWG